LSDDKQPGDIFALLGRSLTDAEVIVANQTARASSHLFKRVIHDSLHVGCKRGKCVHTEAYEVRVASIALELAAKLGQIAECGAALGLDPDAFMSMVASSFERGTEHGDELGIIQARDEELPKPPPKKAPPPPRRKKKLRKIRRKGRKKPLPKGDNDE
jgi:hypothetical protein